MGYDITQNNVTEPLLFLMVDAADHLSPKLGLSPTVVISKNGGAFTTPVGSIGEVGNGWYAVAADPTDAGTIGPLALHATATGADPTDEIYTVKDPAASSTALPGVPTTGVVSFTGSSLIAGALRLLGVLGTGETLDPDIAATGLDVLNELIDANQTNALMLYTDQRVVLPWTANADSLTIGLTGADLAADRPMTIKRAGFLLSTGYEYPLQVLTLLQWAAVTKKDFGASYPRGVYYEPTYPNGTLHLWPVPAGSVSLVLYTGAMLGYVQDLTTVYQLPPGYMRCLRYNLAQALGPEMGLAVPGDVARIAEESRGDVKRQNTRLADLSSRDASVFGRAGARVANSTLEGGRF